MTKPNVLRLFTLSMVACSFLLAARCSDNEPPAHNAGSLNKSHANKIGEEAIRQTEKILAYGHRQPGTEQIEAVRVHLEKEVSKLGYTMERLNFKADTPEGAVDMVNMRYRLSSKQEPNSGKILIGAHYDTKKIDGINFLGVNDAATSVALLLTLTPYLAQLDLPYDIDVVFFDGEEAFVEWTDTDSLYGSQEYVKHVQNLADLKLAVVVDMISDKDLKLIRSYGTLPENLDLMEQVLTAMGKADILDNKLKLVEDDHTPFIESGIPILHLMDFTFGPSGTTPGEHWHTSGDTLANVSAESTGIVGAFLLNWLEAYAARETEESRLAQANPKS